MRSIDADALEEVLEKIPAADIKNIDGQAYTLVRLSQVFNVIEHAPTIEPERKVGKWNFIGNQMFECSECGTCYTQSQFYQMRVRISDTEFPKFCPNCGADMREGSEQA